MSYGLTPGIPGAPEPRMYPHSGYFLVSRYRGFEMEGAAASLINF